MVYVDKYLDAMVPKYWRGGGHMLGTDIEELHDFARAIGLKRGWFQNKTYPHYDLTANKRREALQHGAVSIDLYDRIPDDVLMKRRDGSYEPRRDRVARRARAWDNPSSS